jgi:hypothetical protein
MLGLLALHQAANADTAMTVSRVTLVSTERVSPTVSDYKFAVTFTARATAVVNAIGHAETRATGSKLLDGDVSIGNVAAGASTTPADTITVRQDITRAFNPSSLRWSFQQPPAGPRVQVSVTVSDRGASKAKLNYR